LKNALYAILRGSYNGGISYTACNTALPVIDRDPKNSANVIEIYTGNSVKASDRLSGNVGIWNKEHVYPQSRGSFNTSKNGVGTDCHSLHASDSKVNGARENFNFYQFASDDTNYTKIYTNEGYDSKTKLNSSQGKGFEPVDFVKGECARSVFYMAVMWPEYCSITNTVLQDAPYELGMLKYIIDWNQNDPVDEREKYRNQAVYKYQNNYNPFIDAPEWVNLIWDANGLLI
jgi:endonuclease I